MDTTRMVLLNMILALTNLIAIIPLESTLLSSRKDRIPISALILLSSSSSFAYHLTQNAVRGHGLSGIGVSEVWEFVSLQVDRLVAVSLCLFVSFIHRDDIFGKLKQNARIVATAALAGSLSELVPNHCTAVYVVLHGSWHVFIYLTLADLLR